ncbi:MAG: hypothetical protein MJ249_12740, partial [Kiritimatiellae bacterium]|nr:hypothetical protein [Kiritimatiellia bacterium]
FTLRVHGGILEFRKHNVKEKIKKIQRGMDTPSFQCDLSHEIDRRGEITGYSRSCENFFQAFTWKLKGKTILFGECFLRSRKTI